MNEKTFLQEIIAEPASDEPRLVYADWLADNGDPQGEFIQLQIARESLDPGSIEAQEIRAREDQLLKGNAKSWSNGIHQITPQYGFRRGFVNEVGLGLKGFLEQSDALFGLAPIEVLGVRQCNSARIRELSQCTHLKRIRSLKLAKCTADATSQQRLFSSEYLDVEHFMSDSDSIFDAEISRIFAESSGVQKLRSLRLEQYESIPDIAAIVGNLKSLEFLSCQADAKGAAAIADSDLPLECLSLGSGVGTPGCEEIASSKRLKKLKALDICGNFNAEGGRRLIEIGMPNLERLNVRRHDLTDDTVKTLTKQFPSLCYLDILQNERLTSACVRHLADSPFLSQLRCLRLGLGKSVRENDILTITKSPYFSGEPRMLQFPMLQMNNKTLAGLQEKYGKDFFVNVYGDWQGRRDSLHTLPLLPLPCELP